MTHHVPNVIKVITTMLPPKNAQLAPNQTVINALLLYQQTNALYVLPEHIFKIQQELAKLAPLDVIHALVLQSA